MDSRIVGKLATWFLKVFAWFWMLQPRPLQMVWGHALGVFARLLGYRQKVINGNLEIAYPNEPSEFRKKIYRQAYSSIGHTVFETIALFGSMRRFVGRYSELRGAENWRHASDQKKGVLFLSSHVGNWEVMAATGATHGMPLMLVTKQLKPQWLHDEIEKGRLRCGVSCTYEPKTFKDVLRHLRKGNTVGFVLDQYAGPPIGLRVPFFGQPVGTLSALAAVARRTGAPVVPVVNYRTSSGRFVVDIRPPVEWIAHENSRREVALNTARYAEIVEKDVREHPGQWLWSHRRFKGDLSPLKPGEWEGQRRPVADS